MTDGGPRSQTIAVIGGGIAGITAAVEVAETGYDVVLLEKGPARGGRVGARRVGLGAALKPARGGPSIIWTANDRDGRVKRCKLPIRTAPWGSIEPYPDDARPDSLDRKSTTLFGESKYLGVDRPPTPGAA
jgi:glycine/D-amino acid oxidase-like deaminating enzyme